MSNNLYIKKIISDNDKDNFASLCEEIMNKSNIYDRTLFKNKFKEIYNENKYIFPLSNNMLIELQNFVSSKIKAIIKIGYY